MNEPAVSNQSLWLRRLLPPVIVVGAIALAIALVSLRPQPESVAAEERVVPVQTMTVARSDLPIVIQSQGTVIPRTETTLVAEVSGMVRSVSDKLVSGGYVRQGEVLVILDDADYQVTVSQAEANLLSAEAQLTQEQAQADQAAREWDLSGRPRENAPLLALRTPFLKEAQARVLLAESELARAQRQLERTRIRAPYDALVREKLVDVGQYLGAGSQVAEVFATDYAEIRLPLSANDLAWLDLPMPGQSLSRETVPVELRAEVAGDQQKWRASIVRTEAVVDSSSRMYYAVARIQDPYRLSSGGTNTPLLAGTFVSASLQGRVLSGVYRVPPAAMTNDNQVMVMDQEQRLRLRPVTIIHADTNWLYVEEGIQQGDQVIVSPVRVPVDGMRVNPVQVAS